MHRALLTISLLITASALAADDELQCLTPEQQKKFQLYGQLQQQAYTALDRRNEVLEGLRTPEEIQQRQRDLREFFLRQLGGLPDRSPLNAQTIRTISCDGYRIECVVFDSQPGHRITANLYLPEAAGPVPGVVVSSGHSRTAKTADYNQRFGIMMAQHGMAALCFDPIGQGERSQILKENGQNRFSGTTTEHFLVGVGAILVGRNTARYRVWDAMRAIDYICSRPEVDASRIGFTGCSGGGTVTSYVMALDDRVRCAAPACYLTTFRHLISSIGPQDAEQNIFGQLNFGMDHPDYVLMRAPAPTLISATTGDYFSIAGAWENFRQNKRIYSRLGHPERMDLVEAEGKHGVQPQNLASITHWMKRWLRNDDSPVRAHFPATRPPEELLCTKSGQVAELPGEKTVFELNAEYAGQLAERRTRLHREKSAEQLRILIRDTLRISHKDVSPEFTDLGRVSREDYHIDRLTLRTENSLLGGLTFHPPSPQDDACLYLSENGRLGDTDEGGPVMTRVLDEALAVVTVDMRGQGETAAGEQDALLTDWKTFYLAYLLERPLTGIRVQDALAAADFVAFYEKSRAKPRKVHLVATGRAAIIGLHAAALRPDLFETVTLRNCPRSWTQLVSERVPGGQLDAVVHGALAIYDLPDLVRLAGVDRVRFADEE